MQIDILTYGSGGWEYHNEAIMEKSATDLVLVFGDSDLLKESLYFEELRNLYPDTHIVGASSSGNILGSEVSRSPLVATAVRFEGISVEVKHIDWTEGMDLEALSRNLFEQLPREGLKHIFLLSDGLLINGSALVRALNTSFKGVSVSGGMAGDGGRFEETWIIADEPAKRARVAVVGFYGNAHISSGYFAGWSEFGVERVITRSEGNVLFELDGEPALDLYKKYMGEYAQELPLSGLRFPLSIKAKRDDPEVIRTLLGADEASRSIVFAGDVPQGYTARLMKPDVEVLIGGAEKAAQEIDQLPHREGLALIISCVGRKMVMGEIIDEELEAVHGVLGEGVQMSGFYSYGEIAPLKDDVSRCELHNQTMTLTVIYEVPNA